MRGPQWTTEKEFAFLQNIGTHSEKGTDRKQALAGYLKATEKRTDWSGMDGRAVRNYAALLLGVPA